MGGNQESTIRIAVAGSNSSQSEAQSALQSALNNPDNLLAQKVNGRQTLLAQTKVSLPDAALQGAFEWGKFNMADLKRTVTDAKIRDMDEGRAYPTPAATIPKLTGIGAGYPDYPWYFGTDGAYTAYPMVASGDGWPEGYGMVEPGGMGEEKLDNTAYTWQALRALEAMAESRSDADSLETATGPMGRPTLWRPPSTPPSGCRARTSTPTRCATALPRTRI